ncbi:caspase a isoform X3 [Pimephales promelas]|uniref:caspase a isoform X3 n=1 Tax=Pimephales promelas TaxID=90988 RepID=UPI001955A4DA|nr:caspase a isoform X3 [Pimephales promelas]
MVKTIKEHLEDTFEDLGEEKLRKFKIKLRDRKPENDKQVVRQATIDKIKDALDLADVMVNTFTSKDAVPVTVELLTAIKEHKLAEELRENTRDVDPVGRPGPSAQSDAPVGRPGPSAPSHGLEVMQPQSDDWQRELQVTPCSQSFKNKILQENGQEIYEVKDKFARTRLALLINNRDFNDKAMTRRGAERDEENMEWLLKELGYQVVKYTNVSAEDMKKAVKKFAEREEHANSDSTFVVIMSHGKRNAILGVHYTKDNPSDTFPVDDIYNHLNSENCPALRNKPKVILIQACRGGEHGRVWASDGEPDEPEEIEGDDFVHKEKNFISLMSCTPETKSYRHVENGTFYVQYIVDVFTKDAHKDHIEELFRKVIRRFDSSDMPGSYRQMACKDRASLAKLFYLFPGL